MKATGFAKRCAMRLLGRSVGLALVGSLLVAAADAAPVTKTFGFTASDVQGSLAPSFASVTGSFTVTVDPTTSDPRGTAATVVENALSLGFLAGVPVEGLYFAATDLLAIGAAPNGTSILYDTDDFLLFVSNFLGRPAFDELYVSQVGFGGIATTLTGSVIVAPSAAPEPGPLALVGIGLLVAVSSRRATVRRR